MNNDKTKEAALVLTNDHMQEQSHFLVKNECSKWKYYLHYKRTLQARTGHLKIVLKIMHKILYIIQHSTFNAFLAWVIEHPKAC